MDLLLGQLVYASFPKTGFTVWKSPQVPALIQQHFIERVVSRYWYATNIATSGYRAVYVNQVTPEHTLFGWLYNDGPDDNRGYSYVPNFVCYYLEEPLLDFQLEIIFTCLHTGPVAPIVPHNPLAIATMVLPNLWSYQPSRPGVTIPLRQRQHSQIALRQGELIDLFVPFNEQEMVVELNEQTYEQQIAQLSFYQNYVVAGIAASAGEIDTGITDSDKNPQQVERQTADNGDRPDTTLPTAGNNNNQSMIVCTYW